MVYRGATMTNKPTTFEECLDLLGGRPVATQEALQVPYVTAQMMHRRKSIGDAHWPRLKEVLRWKGVVLSTDDLLEMKQAKRRSSSEVAA